MNRAFTVDKATARDAAEVAAMVGELLGEIMDVIGAPVFSFDLAAATERLRDFIGREKYFVFIARRGDSLLGFITLYEGYALYAGGSVGVIPELYVRRPYRSMDVGRHLVSDAKRLGLSRGWPRLEVTTPPLPHFERSLAFYEREGFSVTGGRKLKINL
jgi:GNAT superfamily N-acetyltransferase